MVISLCLGHPESLRKRLAGRYFIWELISENSSEGWRNLWGRRQSHYKDVLSSWKPLRAIITQFKTDYEGFPGGAAVKNPPANAGDTGWIPGPGRSHMPWSN